MKLRMHLVFLVRALSVVVLLNIAVPVNSAQPRFAQGTALGIVAADTGKEISGIAASVDNPGVLWVHCDSGNGETLWAINSKGALLGAYTAPGITTVDCEGLAIGPGPMAGVSYVYWGDIGDNTENRSHIAVYRFPEPAVSLKQSAKPVRRELGGVVTIKLKYPDRSHNAESLMVDPIEGDLFVGTKTRRKTWFYRAARADMAESREVKLSLVAEIDFDIASDASISPSGAEILVRQEDYAWIFRRSPRQSVADALSGRPSKAPVIGTPAEPNGEAIGFDSLGQGYFTISEGSSQPLYYFKRFGKNESLAPKVLIPAGSKWKYLSDAGDHASGWRELAFDDSAWATAEAPFGFAGQEEPRTVQDRAPGSAQRPTIFFRRQFDSSKLKPTECVVAKLLCSHNAAIYLNGHKIKQIIRTDAASKDSWFTLEPDNAQLLAGKNVVAIEVPCTSPDDCETVVDLQLLLHRMSKSAG